MLTDKEIRGLRPKEKPYRVSDGKIKGLCLEVRTSGSKLWRLRYPKTDGNYTMISLGEYPYTTLDLARKKAIEKKTLRASGLNPSSTSDSQFNTIVGEWLERSKKHWTPLYYEKVKGRINMYVLPYTKGVDVFEINRIHVTDILRRIEQKGAHNTAHKVYQYLGSIFNWAGSMWELSNPAYAAKGFLSPLKKQSYPAPTELKMVAHVLKEIDMYTGSFITTCGLKFLALTMLRPGEVRRSAWKEVNWTEKVLMIPASRMKMRKEHFVPLSEQAIAVLKEIQPLTGHGEYIFPGERSYTIPMSENTMVAALRRMGFSKDEIVAHSFRSIASTLLRDARWDRSWVEFQLAHIDSSVAAIYNRSEYIDQRKEMMQAWGSFLDYLREEPHPTIEFLNVKNWT